MLVRPTSFGDGPIIHIYYIVHETSIMCVDSYQKTCEIEFQTSFNKEQWARPNHMLIAKSNIIEMQ